MFVHLDRVKSLSVTTRGSGRDRIPFRIRSTLPACGREGRVTEQYRWMVHDGSITNPCTNSSRAEHLPATLAFIGRGGKA